MASMGMMRRRAGVVRRMGSKVADVIERHDGDEDAVKAELEQVYGNWVLWLQLAMQLLPILIELFKSLQERRQFRRMAQSVASDLSMQVMHSPEVAENIAHDYELCGELDRAAFLRRWFMVHGDDDVALVVEPQ